MLSAVRSRFREEHGQVLIEFAAILPLFCTLLFGVIDFGRAMNYSADLNHIAAEGARKGAVTSTGGFDLVAFIEDKAEPALAERVTVAVCQPEGADPGDPLMVKATVDHRILKFLPLGDDGPLELTLSGRATMRLEVPTDLGGSVSSNAADCE